MQIKQNSFLVEGQVGSTNEAVIHILPAKIDQTTGTITELPEQTLICHQVSERVFVLKIGGYRG